MAGSDDECDCWPRGPLYDWLRKLQGGKYLGGGVAAILGLWVFTAVTLPLFLRGEKGIDAGTFGDMFGAMNAFVGGITLLGVGYAAYFQHEELREAREQNLDDREKRREDQRIQESQARAQRAASELNAYDSLVRHYTSQFVTAEPGTEFLGVRPDAFARAMADRHLQMMRVVLADIQKPDGEFDWKDTREEERTRFRKFHLCLMREVQKRYLALDRYPLMPGVVVPLLELIKSDSELLLTQEGLNGEDIRWTRGALNAVAPLLLESERLVRLKEVPDEAYNRQVEILLVYYHSV